jgi:hypothetical protein
MRACSSSETDECATKTLYFFACQVSIRFAINYAEWHADFDGVVNYHARYLAKLAAELQAILHDWKWLDENAVRMNKPSPAIL